MDLRIKLRNDPSAITAEEARVIAKALTQAFREGGAAFKQRGRAAIRAGGLSLRFASGLSARVYPQNGNSMSPRIFGYHHIPWAGQFENPEPISGNIWLPIDKNLPGGQRWTPSKYIKAGGKLRRGRGPSARYLFGQVTFTKRGFGKALRRAGKGGTIRKAWVPFFFLVGSVRDPKLFDLGPVGEAVASDIGNNFTKALANG